MKNPTFIPHLYGKYLIDYQDGDYHSFVGEGILTEINPKGYKNYPNKVYEFYLPSETSMGYFGLENIKSHSGELFVTKLDEETLNVLFDAVVKGVITKGNAIRGILEYMEMFKEKNNL